MSAPNVMAQVVKLVLIKTANFNYVAALQEKGGGTAEAMRTHRSGIIVIMPIHKVDAEIFHLISENFLQLCAMKSQGVSTEFF